MSKRYATGLHLGLWAACLVPAFASCGGDYAIFVRIGGIPSETIGLSVTAKLGDTYANQGMEIVPSQDMVGVRLPGDKSGILTVEISAIGSDECKAARGSVQVDLGKGRAQEVSLGLSALAPRLCSLIVNKSGEGTVTTNPVGTPCGTNCFDYPKNTPVVLGFVPEGKSYGAQVFVRGPGYCDGTNDCSVTVIKRIQVEAKFQPRLCSLSKWCWYHPLPQGNILRGIHGTSGTDIWAVGDGGTTLHYDGTAWSIIPSGTDVFLKGVWGNAPGSYWVVGDQGKVLRWNGTSFTAETSTTGANLHTVWGSGPGNVYAGGDNGVIVRSAGNGTWRTESSGTTVSVKKISGSDDKNVWAVGGSTTVLNSSGGSWSSQTLTSQTNVNDLYVSGTNDVWVGSGMSSGTCNLSRWNGTTWLHGIAGASCKSGITALSGTGPGDVWAAGADKTVLHLTEGDPKKQTTVTLFDANIKGTQPTFNAAWNAGPADVYLATSQGNVIRRVGEQDGTQFAGPLPFIYSKMVADFLVVTTGTPTMQYFLYGDGTTYSYDGRKFNALPTVPSIYIYDGWTPPDNAGMLIATSDNGQVFRYSGGSSWTLSKLGSTSNVISIGGVTSNDYYVGTFSGYIYRFVNGTIPGTALSGGPYPIQSIWGRAVDEVWASGGSGSTYRINNGVVTKVTNPAPVGSSLYAISGPPSPSKQAWAVGSGGTVIKFDGSNWSTVQSGVATDLHTVVALTETEVWIAGAAGVLLRWDDAQKKLVRVAGPFASRSLARLHSPSPNNLWLVGGADGIWRYMP